MKFCEAMDAMQGGAKVTRKPWAGSIYFQMKDAVVHAYQPKIIVYQYHEDIMLSDGWIVDGEEGEKKFCDIITPLTQGKTAKQKDWNGFIYFDPNGKQLIFSCMEAFPYSPDFESFVATDWMTVQ